MSQDRTKRPAELDRELRKEAGYGCCRCGKPFIEYHHILGYEVTGHAKDQMMVLCPECHYLATVGAIVRDEQYRLKASPFNQERGFALGALFVTAQDLVVRMGLNWFVGEGVKIAVDTVSMLSIRKASDGAITLSTSLYDRGDRLLLELSDNEWITGDTNMWDMEFKPRWLRLREKRRTVNLIVDARNDRLSVTGVFWKRGFSVTINDSEIVVGPPIDTHIIGFGFFDGGFSIGAKDGESTIGPIGEGDSKFLMKPLAGAPTEDALIHDLLEEYHRWRRE